MRSRGSFDERFPRASAWLFHLAPPTLTVILLLAVPPIESATFGGSRVLPLSAWWDAATIAWSVVGLGATVMAGWSSMNLRCPRCRGEMTVSEPLHPLGELVLGLFGLDSAPHQRCEPCGVKTPLRSPRHPGWWGVLATLCGGVLLAVYAQRTHALGRFVRWFVG